MADTIADSVLALNRIKRRATLIAFLLRCLRAAVLSVMTVALWAQIRPNEELEQLSLGVLAFALSLLAGLRTRIDHAIDAKSLVLALEMRYGANQPSSLTALPSNAPVPADWAGAMRAFRAELKHFERARNLALASSLVLPLILTAVTVPMAVPSLRLALSEVSNVVALLNRGVRLKVLQGASAEQPEQGYVLSADKPLTIELLAQNLVTVEVSGGGFRHAVPIVELRKPRRVDSRGAETAGSSNVGTKAPSDEVKRREADLPPQEIELKGGSGQQHPAEEAKEQGDDTKAKTKPEGDEQKSVVYQKFQMTPQRGTHKQDSEDAAHFLISFAASEPLDLYIPQIDAKRPLAHLKVRVLPIPKVQLVALHELEDPWPDDQPIMLKIDVAAENPLQAVRLLIKSGSRTAKELVANVMTEDKTDLSTEYKLVLESYVESDLAQVEIIAEAIDRALPAPLVGYSEPLRINTASAYGRYRQALGTLRELKTLVDEALDKKLDQLPEKAHELARKASEQSERSPFFDGLDRVVIQRFEARSGELLARPSFEGMMDLEQQLNDFLFEHEILDDRERDRDFFVAVRSMSRLLEKNAKERPSSVKTVSERIKKYLDDRMQRWEKRVARLPEADRPSDWPRIASQKPFHGAMSEIEALDAASGGDSKARSKQLAILSKVTVDFRTFIEDLEAREDKVRSDEEKQRQEGLASARNALRELQLRQNEVSEDLDRADERSKTTLAENWPSTRMKQNANAKEAKQLEGQMRAVAPSAGARIEAAHKAMQGTLDAGANSDFQLAESYADMAGRLLRQAEKAAQQSQQKRRDRGRRRRVTGDNYYGQSVVGGDIEIKREYQVDRRYREDILEELQGSSLDEEQRALLENYLRQIIR